MRLGNSNRLGHSDRQSYLLDSEGRAIHRGVLYPVTLQVQLPSLDTIHILSFLS
jgi:hypothetical protein